MQRQKMTGTTLQGFLADLKKVWIETPLGFTPMDPTAITVDPDKTYTVSVTTHNSHLMVGIMFDRPPRKTKSSPKATK